MMNPQRWTRRRVLKVGGGAAVLAAGGGLSGGCQPKRSAPAVAKTSRPRNVIFCVSDGMSAGVPAMAEQFDRLVRDGRGTRWQQLMQNTAATHGYLHTASASSLVTDSAAAASAWGAGSRVANGTLNILPEGTRLVPLAVSARNRGMKVGLASTDKIVGATPAGFVAVQPSRNNYDAIALDYLDVVDVLLGGGRKFFSPGTRADELDVIGKYRTRGYTVVNDRERLLAGGGDGAKLLGLFAPDVMPYTLEHRHDGELRRTTPTLAEMSRAALDRLAGAEQGFVLQIEGARIDHAGHANDAAAMLWDQLAFDDAVRVALDFAADDGQTLVIVTSDHGCANPGLNGYGPSYNHSTQHFQRMAKVKRTIAAMHNDASARAKGGDNARATREAIIAGTDIAISDQEAALLAEGWNDADRLTDANAQHRRWFAQWAQVLGNHTGVQFTGTSHTNDHMILTAIGPGAGALAGLRHHTDVHHILADHLRIAHRNPTAAAATVA